MVSIKQASYQNQYRIKLLFSSGEEGVVDFGPVIERYAQAESLKDMDEFRKFYLDDWPTLAWPCGFDVSPETLYELATGKPPLWAAKYELAA